MDAALSACAASPAAWSNLIHVCIGFVVGSFSVWFNVWLRAQTREQQRDK